MIPMATTHPMALLARTAKRRQFLRHKEIWSPVYINPQPIDAGFDGKIPVENRYAFTNLNQCTFKWKLVKLPSAQSKTTAAASNRQQHYLNLSTLSRAKRAH
jgi:hypothetical protein